MFALFFALLFCGTPIAVALGLAGVVGIWLGDLSLFAVPTNVYAGIAKYPILAVPMFVLAGAIFDRSGVAARLVDFAAALVGRGRGSLARRHRPGRHVPRRNLRLRPGQCRGRRRRDDDGHDARRLSPGILRDA